MSIRFKMKEFFVLKHTLNLISRHLIKITQISFFDNVKCDFLSCRIYLIAYKNQGIMRDVLKGL